MIRPKGIQAETRSANGAEKVSTPRVSRVRDLRVLPGDRTKTMPGDTRSSGTTGEGLDIEIIPETIVQMAGPEKTGFGRAEDIPDTFRPRRPGSVALTML